MDSSTPFGFDFLAHVINTFYLSSSAKTQSSPFKKPIFFNIIIVKNGNFFIRLPFTRGPKSDIFTFMSIYLRAPKPVHIQEVVNPDC